MMLVLDPIGAFGFDQTIVVELGVYKGDEKAACVKKFG
jgi:hypothetical protein